jgi:hypothetical protein
VDITWKELGSYSWSLVNPAIIAAPKLLELTVLDY